MSNHSQYLKNDFSHEKLFSAHNINGFYSSFGDERRKKKKRGEERKVGRWRSFLYIRYESQAYEGSASGEAYRLLRLVISILQPTRHSRDQAKKVYIQVEFSLPEVLHFNIKTVK